MTDLGTGEHRSRLQSGHGAVRVQPACVGVMEHRGVESQPRPTGGRLGRGEDLTLDARLEKYLRLGLHGLRQAVIDGAGEFQEPDVRRGLQLPPQRQRVGRQTCVPVIVVRLPVDTRSTVRRTVLVTRPELFQLNYATSACREPPCGGGPDESSADDDHIENLTHGRELTWSSEGRAG